MLGLWGSGSPTATGFCCAAMMLTLREADDLHELPQQSSTLPPCPEHNHLVFSAKGTFFLYHDDGWGNLALSCPDPVSFPIQPGHHSTQSIKLNLRQKMYEHARGYQSFPLPRSYFCLSVRPLQHPQRCLVFWEAPWEQLTGAPIPSTQGVGNMEGKACHRLIRSWRAKEGVLTVITFYLTTASNEFPFY